ncbi:MAG: hypothetical protein IAI49_13670 [Candidatus Eremiobacteraeota bacterium]|nr:hypothetical protein [Candidatus Eremiobacteraeota bacterium]
MATHTEIERRTAVLRSPPPPSVFRRISRTFRKAKRDSPVARGFMLFAVAAAFMVQYVFVMHRVSTIGHPAAATKVHPAAASQAGAQFLPVDDSGIASVGEHFRYTGSWEHLKNLNDGRSLGTSSRTMQTGAEASFRFTASG